MMKSFVQAAAADTSDDATSNIVSTRSNTFAGGSDETGLAALTKGGGSWFRISPLFLCLTRQEIDMDFLRTVMAEMVGTFILMFSVCGIIASTRLSRGEVGLMDYAAAAGLSVVVIIFAIGHISGAHVNPAVTVAFAIFGPFPWSRVPYYIVAQTAGAVLATWIGNSIYGIPAELMATRPLHGSASAFWVELVATLIVVFSASSVLYESQAVGRLAGVVVGVVIGLGVLITGPISGGSMNPARSLGPVIVSWNFEDVWIYIIGPVVGAVAGAFLYRLLRLKPRRSVATSSPDSLTSQSSGFEPQSSVI